MTSPGDVGESQVIICWMLPSSLTDTSPIARPVTTPGVCAAEHDLNDTVHVLDSIGKCLTHYLSVQLIISVV